MEKLHLKKKILLFCFVGWFLLLLLRFCFVLFICLLFLFCLFFVFEGVGLVTIKSFQINIFVCSGLRFEHWKSPFVVVVFKFQFVVE